MAPRNVSMKTSKGLGRHAFPSLSLFLSSSLFFPLPLDLHSNIWMPGKGYDCLGTVYYLAYEKVLFLFFTHLALQDSLLGWIILVWAFCVILGWHLMAFESFFYIDQQPIFRAFSSVWSQIVMDQLIKYLLFVCFLFQVKPGLQPRAAHFQAAKPVKPVKQALLLPAKLKVLDITDFWDYVVSCFKFLPLYFLINFQSKCH